MAKKVLIKTSLGNIVIRLYDETPKHRDNFLKLVADGTYNGTLFHRVIKDFMVQGGDPDSKGAPAGKQLGTGGLGSTIPAEFVYPQYFHKRGALAAARQGDEVNPEKASSDCQFYIVWGQTYKEGQLTQMEKQMEMQQLQGIFNGLVAKHRDAVMEMRKNRDRDGLMALQEQLEKEARAEAKKQGAPKLTEEQKTIYTTVGGTPFLDNQYTVFGEVEEGLDIVGKIQECETAAGDRPKEDISMTMEVVEA